MFAVQLALAIAIWAGTIVLLVKRRERLISAARKQTRVRRTLEAAGALLGSIIVMLLLMIVLVRGGLTNGVFTLFGWVATTLAGAAFVTLQTIGLVPLVVNAVTTDKVGSSDRKESTPS